MLDEQKRAERSRDASGTYPCERLDQCHWRNPIRIMEQGISGENSPSWDHPELPDSNPGKYNQPEDGQSHKSRANEQYMCKHRWKRDLVPLFSLE
jgi:hypothetical protein